MTNNEWIRVEERLPYLMYQDVLVCSPGDLDSVIEIAYLSGDDEFHNEISSLKSLYGRSPTHWTPIPEPPEEVEENR